MSRLKSGSISYGGVSFQFGEGTPFALTGFQRGTATIRDSNRDVPRRDGRRSGRAFKSAPTHDLSVAVLGEGSSRVEREADCRALLREISSVWSADRLRATPGMVAKLTIGDFAAYGWPRTLAPDDSGLWDGTAQVDLAFDARDDLWYGPEETTMIRFASSTGGGLRFPARAPFRFGGQPTVRNSSVLVGGVMDAAPVFEVRGPVVDPTVDIPGVGALIFNVTLAYDQRLVVDTREGWVKRGRVGGELHAFPGALSAQGARLSDIRLSPGAHNVVLRGTDSTNTAELLVMVQPAYTSF